MKTEIPAQPDTFAQLNLNPRLLQALNDLGYETPTPIQLQTIPLLLAGRDLIGQAQTGTGKTAAFALPILERLDLSQSATQALVLAPTRELAIQVAEAIHAYARHLGPVRVMPVYGGDPIYKQLQRLRAGLHVVVGTPGRVMDHLRRGTLTLEALKIVVLDEADEMLRMGFIEDIEWILEQAPAPRQTVLFSATMPPPVRRITGRYLTDPVTVEIKHKTLTVPTVEQRYLHVLEKQKLETLTHVLEVETAPEEANLIFVRTKLRAAEVADKLQMRGYAVEAMHGDMNQSQRESVIRRMREGQVDTVVATDVAARGLDIDHIARVINYDIPNDPESYIHRIGRTARAGRAGQAILFIAPRETRMLQEIERHIGQRLSPMKVPNRADVAARRIALFKAQLLKTLESENLEIYLALVEELAEESGRDLAEIAAAAARLARGDKPLSVTAPETEYGTRPLPPTLAGAESVRFHISVGLVDNVRPADIVGAIANEADVAGKHIGPIDIRDDSTLVEVPVRYYEQVLNAMRGAKIRNLDARTRLATAKDGELRPKSRGLKKTYAPPPAEAKAHSKSKHKGKRS